MPLGNGDIGLNLWVEEGGDLLFYISKTDAWDEHARLLKLGRVRVRFSPNPFAKGLPFRQELKLRQGEIEIRAGEKEAAIAIRTSVDANHPVIRVEAVGERPFTAEARLEVWRDAARPLSAEEANGVDRFARDLPPATYPDVVLRGETHRIVWYHRNGASLWRSTLEHQDVGSFARQSTDPLLHLTFGAAMSGDGLIAQNDRSLGSPQPRKKFALAIHALTAQTATAEEWLSQLDRTIATVEAIGVEKSRAAHHGWWDAFWNRSWVRVATARREAGARKSGSVQATDAAFVVSQGYALQRFINACGGRGQYPIKFNGSIFTVDAPGKFDPDYRRWGGCYWFQNTRLPYWPMLGSGDFDLMEPLFAMYRDALPLARARTEIYFRHDGAFFPETMYFWGAYHNGEFGYGSDRAGEPLGRPVNRYIRYYWSGGLELSAMMLDYYAFEQDQVFLKSTVLPLAGDIIEFYNRHYPREPHGKILFAPAQSLETWWECENPMPEVAGLRFVLGRLLALPSPLAGDALRARWKRLLDELPAVPTREIDAHRVLAPGESFRTQQNMENPELYAVFPYRLYGVGKPDLETAVRTFEHRQFKGHRGWQQDDTQAAFLGLAEEARRDLVGRFTTKNPESRFPAFWGPNFDWIPDQDHGSNGLMALQTMLLQSDGRKILLFPAWPKDWDVEFKLHAPFGTTVEGVYRAGKIRRLTVTPIERAKDVMSLVPQ